MQNRFRFWGLLSFALLAVFIVAFSQNSQIQSSAGEQEDLRSAAKKAMQELRYRDALDLLDRLEKQGKSTFDDKNNALICLEKLRLPEQLDKRLAQYLEKEKDPFDKGQLLEWEVRRLMRQNRWNNRNKIVSVYRMANALLKEHADSKSRRLAFARFLLNEIKTIKGLTTMLSQRGQ